MGCCSSGASVFAGDVQRAYPTLACDVESITVKPRQWAGLLLHVSDTPFHAPRTHDRACRFAAMAGMSSDVPVDDTHSTGQASFRFVDLFAGVGGFHAALSAYGGECVYAVEIDKAAARVYERNWGLDPLGDVTKDASDEVMAVGGHEILAAGFPCQPFSKSGAQKGMDETRGTLYWNILKIIQARKPEIVLLENVRNLAGPRHRHEWQVIIETLRDEGYHV